MSWTGEKCCSTLTRWARSMHELCSLCKKRRTVLHWREVFSQLTRNIREQKCKIRSVYHLSIFECYPECLVIVPPAPICHLLLDPQPVYDMCGFPSCQGIHRGQDSACSGQDLWLLRTRCASDEYFKKCSLKRYRAGTMIYEVVPFLWKWDSF